jgi:hypothetical protein
MSQGDELKLQRCAAANTEREQETRADRIVIMHPDAMAVVPEKSSIILDGSQFLSKDDAR